MGRHGPCGDMRRIQPCPLVSGRATRAFIDSTAGRPDRPSATGGTEPILSPNVLKGSALKGMSWRSQEIPAAGGAEMRECFT